jgi:serine protease Do
MKKLWKEGAIVIIPVLASIAAIFLSCRSGFSNNLTLETKNQAVASSKDLDIAIGFQNIYHRIAKSVTPAVVSIQVESEEIVQNPLDDYFNDSFFKKIFGDEGQGMPKQYKQKVRALGSGFIVTKDGYIFTNDHVVKDMTKIQVILADNRKFKAKVIGTDPETDIAVLKINADNLPIVAVGDSGEIQVGDLVIAIGNPFGLTGTYTSGIISFVGRPGIMSGFQHFIQTDAPVNPGNSGGPLVNVYGQVIAINTAIQTQSGGYEGISFAVPIDTAKEIAGQLISGGSIKRGYLGVLSIGQLDATARKVFGIPGEEGVLVSKLEKNGPAALAGLKPGDIITRANGGIVKTTDDLQVTIGNLKPGLSASLEVYRQRACLTIEVKLTERPKNLTSDLLSGKGERNNPSGETYKFKGVAFAPAGQDVLDQNGAQYGVVVQDITDDSPLSGALERGKLVVGINETEIHDLNGLQAFVGKNSDTNLLVFAVMQNGYLIYRGVEK